MKNLNMVPKESDAARFLRVTREQQRQAGVQPMSSPKKLLIGVGAVVYVGIMTVAVTANISAEHKKAAEAEAAEPSSVAQDTQASSPAGKAFAAMNAKVNPIVSAPLDGSYDPEGFAKLGKRVWGVANEFRRWAALAAAQSDSCDGVRAVANWKNATRNNLIWRVVCSNDEIFLITEDQARSLQARFDPKATVEDRRKYANSISVAQPVSAKWKNFTEVDAVVACEEIMKRAAVDRGSYDSDWTWDITRDEEAGTATIVRNYSASNAMGGTLSGTYQCTVRIDGSVISLKARDAMGVRTVI